MAITDESVKPEDLPSIAESPEFIEHLPAIITGVRVWGGDDGEGVSNFQARVLDARTRWLKELAETLQKSLETIQLSTLHFIGKLPDEDALKEIDTTTLPENSVYFVGTRLAVWNSVEWVVSDSLQGVPGEGVGDGDDSELLLIYQSAKG